MKTQQDRIKSEILDRIQTILQSGKYSMGHEETESEVRLSKFPQKRSWTELQWKRIKLLGKLLIEKYEVDSNHYQNKYRIQNKDYKLWLHYKNLKKMK